VTKSTKNLRQDSQYPGRKPNSASQEYSPHTRSVNHLKKVHAGCFIYTKLVCRYKATK